MDTLSQTGTVIDALGGTATVARITGRKPQAVSNWRRRDTFPPDTFLVLSGALTLKGKSLPASLPFTLTIAGNSATMQGKTTVDRLAYEIGTESDGSGTFVSKDIAIAVELVATRQ